MTADTDATPFRAGALKRLEAFLGDKVVAGRRAGYAWGLATAQGATYLGAAGFSDLGAGARMAPDSRMRIASLTKAVTSVAMLSLLEEAALDLADPVSRFIPAFADMAVADSLDAAGVLRTRPAAGPITLEQLLTHTSGLGAAGDLSNPAAATYAQRYMSYFDCRTLEEAAAWVAAMPLCFDPGTAWGYSYGVDVIARIVEIVSGAPFEQFVARRILQPLGMRDTEFGGVSASRERLASIYETAPDGRLAPVPDLMLDRLTFPLASGGLISTAPDFLRFARMLLGRGAVDGVEILSPAAVDLLARNRLPLSQRPVRLGEPVFDAGFGLGLAVIVDEPATRSLLAVGDYFWSGATDTFFFVSPSRGACAVVLTQHWPNAQDFGFPTWREFAALASAALR